MSHDENENVSVLIERINNLIMRLDRFEDLSETRFVTRLEFTPIQKLVYGGVGIAMSLVLVAVLGLALIQK